MVAINSNRAIRGPVTAVPVMAGNGVVLRADTENNRIVVELDETVLWEGDTGQLVSGTPVSITLSETATNFECLDVTFRNSFGVAANTINVSRFSSSASELGLTTGFYATESTVILCDSATLNVSGTAVTATAFGRFNISANGTISVTANRGLRILKIVGINRKA